jgi:hypothetical protein
VWFPSVIYRLRVYYLELGEFIYTQKEEEIPEWEERGWAKIFTPIGEWWDNFFTALGWWNPFNIFGPYAGFAAFLFTLLIVGFIALIIVAIFFPWVIPRLGKVFRETKDAVFPEKRKNKG